MARVATIVSFAGGLAAGVLIQLVLRGDDSPTRGTTAREEARRSPIPLTGQETRSEEGAEVSPRRDPETRLRVQLAALEATHESLDDRAREAERTVEKLERRIRVLEQELRWARGQEQKYIRTYPEDDIEEVIRIRAQLFMDFGFELDVYEMHEMVRLRRRLDKASREARAAAKGDQQLRMRLTDEAKREFAAAAEEFLPPEKMQRIRDRWDYLWR